MKLQIKVNPATGVIEDAKFKTFGCGSAIASSCLATEWLKGKTVDEALAIKNTDIVNELSLPPVKIHCSVLAEDAIKAAIADYKKKQGTQPTRVRRRTRADCVDMRSDAVELQSLTETMIEMTESAARKIRTMMAKQGINEGGCAWRERRRLLGFELHVRVGTGSALGRRGVRRPDGAKIFVDKKSLLYLNGTVLDYDTSLISRGFVFNNPNAKSTCGCGSSFGA